MPTGMHDTGGFRHIAVLAGFVDRQRIHIRAKTNGTIASPSTQDADDPLSLVNLEPGFSQEIGNHRLGARFLKPKFRMPMEIVPQLSEP